MKIYLIVEALNVPGEWDEDERLQLFYAYCTSHEQYEELKSRVTAAGLTIEYEEPEELYMEISEPICYC